MKYHVLTGTHSFIVAALLLTATTLHAQFATFTPTDGPQGGIYYTMAEGGDGTLFVGMEYGIIYRSLDRGEHWEWCSNKTGMSFNIISQITAGTSGIVLAAAEPFSTVSSQVIRSGKNGQQGSWTFVTALNGKVGVVNQILAGSDSLFVVLADSGIYRSVGGTAWTRVLSGVKRVSGGTITTDGTMYATVDLPTSTMLYRSNDHGINWQPRGDTIANPTMWGEVPVVSNFGSVLVPTSKGQDYNSTLIRLDSGMNAVWKEVGDGLPPSTGILDLAIDRSGVVFACTEAGIYRSTDNGDIWEAMNDPFPNVLPDQIVPLSSGALGILSSYHLFRTDSAGQQWDYFEQGIKRSYCEKIIITGRGTLLTQSGFGSDICRSTDGGATWTYVVRDLIACYTLARDSDGTVMAGGFRGIYRSTDDGENWEAANVGLVSSLAWELAAGAGIWYAATDSGMHRSTDQGRSWKRSNAGIPSYRTRFIAMTPGGSVFVGTEDAGIYRSDDKGVTWHDVNNGLQNPDVLFLTVTASGALFMKGWAETSPVHRSTDNGETWNVITSLLPVIEPTMLKADRYGSLFTYGFNRARTNVFLARSTDNGNHWVTVSQPINVDNLACPILDFDYDSSGIMYVAARGGSVWRSQKPLLLGVKGQQAEREGLKMSISSKGATSYSINYGLAVGGRVTLGVYDALGIEVRSLWDDGQPPGEHSIMFDAGALAGGIYYVRLSTDQMVAVQPVVITR